MKNSRPIVFFDGHCNLCNSFVDFLVRNDPHHRVLIASLQGKTAQESLNPEFREILKSVVLLEGDKVYLKSAAVFGVAKIVKGPFLFLLPLWLIPRPVTDWIYDVIANNRYKIFGKQEICRFPTEREKKHFLP